MFKFSALEKAYREADMTSEREHVTPYIWKNASAEGGTMFKSAYLKNRDGDFPARDWRITIDEPEDFEVLKLLIESLGTGRSWKSYVDYLLEHKDIYAINSRFGYNEGYAKSLRNDKKIK